MQLLTADSVNKRELEITNRENETNKNLLMARCMSRRGNKYTKKLTKYRQIYIQYIWGQQPNQLSIKLFDIRHNAVFGGL